MQREETSISLWCVCRGRMIGAIDAAWYRELSNVPKVPSFQLTGFRTAAAAAWQSAGCQLWIQERTTLSCRDQMLQRPTEMTKQDARRSRRESRCVRLQARTSSCDPTTQFIPRTLQWRRRLLLSLLAQKLSGGPATSDLDSVVDGAFFFTFFPQTWRVNTAHHHQHHQKTNFFPFSV